MTLSKTRSSSNSMRTGTMMLLLIYGTVDICVCRVPV